MNQPLGPIEVTSNDRLLMIGASGWLGKTLQSLLATRANCLTLASSTRERYRIFSKREVAEFDPTHVVNLACVTTGYGEGSNESKIAATNEELIGNFVWASSLPSVRSILTVSSGASVAENLDARMNQYRIHKQNEEKAAAELRNPNRNVVVARAWSLSGPFVTRPAEYAFSDFILQAARGHISIHSEIPTFRAYTSASDFMHVAMRLMLSGWNGTMESGGEIIELENLAERIRAIVNPAATLSRKVVSGRASYYLSKNDSWERVCESLGFVPMNLDQQIREATMMPSVSSGDQFV